MTSTSSVRTCYNCGDPNHFARWCPHNTAMTNVNRTAVTIGQTPIPALPPPPTFVPPPPPPPLQANVGVLSGSSTGQYSKGTGWTNLSRRVAVLEDSVGKMKAWYDAAIEKEVPHREEKENVSKEKEKEERRLNKKREREALNKKFHDAMNARLDEMYEVVRGQKRRGNNGEPTMEKLLKEIEKLQLAQSTVGRNHGASTSGPPICDDTLLAKMMQEHKDMEVKLEMVAVVNKRVESLEESLKAVKQQHEHALQEAENWKKQALRSGNKWSWLAKSPSSQLKMPSTTPCKSTLERPSIDPTQLAQLHTLEVNALKEM
ncbi:hypothetical protein CBR_g3097 [Chara braunii]|uniref:CCHC-type domain-containing protein n=1 Tax=Chara braunii TaxID=69332 RepID=A0A388KF28_CHABU|nr:hypothetical protein CBR_g3097 [Chara braunii]|eukprot:GBG68553.1 hypothetical protein CBR_g3097 [Chara braunii]